MGDLLRVCPEAEFEPEYCENTCPYRFRTNYTSSNGDWYYCRRKFKATEGKPITYAELIAMQRENKTGA